MGRNQLYRKPFPRQQTLRKLLRDLFTNLIEKIIISRPNKGFSSFGDEAGVRVSFSEHGALRTADL